MATECEHTSSIYQYIYLYTNTRIYRLRYLYSNARYACIQHGIHDDMHIRHVLRTLIISDIVANQILRFLVQHRQRWLYNWAICLRLDTFAIAIPFIYILPILCFTDFFFALIFDVLNRELHLLQLFWRRQRWPMDCALCACSRRRCGNISIHCRLCAHRHWAHGALLVAQYNMYKLQFCSNQKWEKWKS